MLVEIRMWDPCDPNTNLSEKRYNAMMLDTNIEFDEWGNAINRSPEQYAKILWNGSVFTWVDMLSIRIEDDKYIIEENTV